MILKILKKKKSTDELFESKLEKRFNKEIKALKKCKAENFQNIIDIYHSGVCKVFNPYLEKFEAYSFYCMEYANFDLKSYLEQNVDLSLNEKVSLCLSLSQGIKELESLGFYHRDIKPDNIFIVDDIWKIGDLGLIAERDIDEDIDDINDFIGPRGWHSPEAMNKYLCEGKKFIYTHDCIIDHQSDIFQLGKVFWYIIQNNAPTGAFKQQDSFIKKNELYCLIRTMLNYSKKKRYKNIDEVIRLLKPIEYELYMAS